MKQNTESNLTKNDSLKYEYKINMNSLVDLFKLKMIKIAIETDDEKREKIYMTLLSKIKHYLISIRPNRSFPHDTQNTNNKHTTNPRCNY